MDFFEVQFALDTFYAVMAGALVMWMAAGFTMLEAGMVRAKNASEIVTKNLGLYSIACIMYLTCGFYLMYSSGDYLGGLLPQIGSHWSLAVPEDTVAAMQYGADGDVGYYAEQADFFPSCFCCNRNVDCFRCCCWKNENVTFLSICCCFNWFHLSNSRILELG